MDQIELHKLSVVMPAYNEAQSIIACILETIKVLENFHPNFEFIIVDDGSLDETFNLIQKIACTDERIIALRISENNGKGNALKYGVRYTTGKWVAFLDADLDLHPSQLESFVKLLKEKNADVIIGSKMHKQSKVDYPTQRYIISRIYFYILSFLFGLKVSDTQVGIKLFNGDLIRKVMEKILVKRFAYDVEVLVLCSRMGAKIIEHAVILEFQSGSPWGRMKFKDLWYAGLDTLAIFYRLYILKYYDRC